MQLQQIIQYLGLLAVGTFSVQLAYPISSRYPIAFSLVFLMAGLTRLRQVWVPLNALAYAATALTFVLTYYLTGAGSVIARTDALWALLIGAVSFKVVAITDDMESWRRFWFRLTRMLYALGIAAAVAGLAKLVLAGKGVYLAPFNDELGRYIPGTSTTTEYNTYAYLLAIAIACGLWMRRCDPDARLRVAAEAGLGVMALALLLTGSRRALLFLLAPILVMLVQRLRGQGMSIPERSPGSSGYSGVIAILLAVAALFAMPGSVSRAVLGILESSEVEKVLDRTLTAFEQDSMQTRLPLFDHAIGTIAAAPIDKLIFGSGFGYLTDFAGRFSSNNLEMYPHNFILSSMLYGGLLQTGLLLTCIAQTGLWIWRARPLTGVLGYILLVTIIFSAISSNSLFSTPVSIFFLIFGAHPILRQIWHEGLPTVPELRDGVGRCGRPPSVGDV
jgi:hypothetical protein